MAAYNDATDSGEWAGSGQVILYQRHFRIRMNGGMTHTSNGSTIETVEHYRPRNLHCTIPSHWGAKLCDYGCVPMWEAPKSYVVRSRWDIASEHVTLPATIGQTGSFKLYRYAERRSVAWPMVASTAPQPTPEPVAAAAPAPAPATPWRPWTTTAQAETGWLAFKALVSHVATIAALQAAANTPGTMTAAAVAKLSTLDRLVRYLQARRADGSRINPWLWGPAGCGKTTIAKLAAEQLGVPFRMLKLTRSSIAEDIVGQDRPLGGGKDWVFHHTAFTTTMVEGGLILLDEFDHCDANTATAIHDATANGHMVINGQVVERHPDSYVVVAANTAGHGADRLYHGAEPIGAATLSRFQRIRVDYDPEFEADIIAQCADDQRDVLRAFHTSVRKVIKDNALPRVWSTRHLIDWVALVNVGIPVEDLAAEYFEDWDRNNLRTARDARVPFTPAPLASERR